MRILVVGGGGREHALCHALLKSPRCTALHAAPGNAGMANVATCHDVAAEDIEGQLALAVSFEIDLVVVGPEAPLAAGLIDRLEEVNILAFGPKAAAAELEASKSFTRKLCDDMQIPGARNKTFDGTDIDAALAYIEKEGAPIVIKADGLAAGKGVVVAETVEVAKDAARTMLETGADARIVVEECLIGEEASLFALCDGTTAIFMGTAQDHKRAYDGDKGPNTGGMGAYSPSPCMTEDLVEQAMKTIIAPALKGMSSRETPFRGFLYAGLMLTADGPKLIEFNVRFGDPEAQVVLPRLESDLVDLMDAASSGKLHGHDARFAEDRHGLTVVMAAKGYPGAYAKGDVIGGLDKLEGDPELVITHAGTRAEDGKILSNGGRVLNVSAFAESLSEAQKRCYEAVGTIDWPDGFFRNDIGWRALDPHIRTNND